MESQRVAAVRLRIGEMMDPLKSEDAEIESEIQTLEGQLSEAREVRRRVLALIRSFEPDYKRDPRPTNGAAKRKQGGGRTVSEEAVERFSEWLTQRATILNSMNSGEGFTATQLAETMRDVLPVGARTQSTISRALVLLHERGVVRLVKANQGRGGSKLYKVVG